MRDYKKKMERYSIPREQYLELRAFCLKEGAQPFVLSALHAEFGEAPDTLQWWIFQHVTRTDYSWAYMEAHQIPCSKVTFYVYRRKFYWYLLKELKGGNQRDDVPVV